jgi:hypothetical protein
VMSAHLDQQAGRDECEALEIAQRTLRADARPRDGQRARR